MIKNVFLYVRGDDYSALAFEQNFNEQQVYEQMVREGKETAIFESDEYYIEVTIKEFDNVDPKFVSFIRNSIMDYDDAKHKDFIEVDYLEV